MSIWTSQGRGLSVSLSVIVLSCRNHLTFLPENIKSLTNLRTLNLSYNSLSSLPSGLVLLSSLKTLVLNNLYLTELPEVSSV